jgi:hypothetical protein
MHPRQETPLGPAALARRLRELRERHWPGVRVTQSMLAEALGGSVPMVSGWESTTSSSVPPVPRLRSYATIFSTRRSLRDGQLRPLPEEELTEEERAERDALYQELLNLRSTAADQAAARPTRRSSWHFPDGGPVRLICGRLAPELAGAFASPTSPNYTQLRAFTDLDALVELFGHIRVTNPDADVRFLLAEEIEPDDLSAHMVLIGGQLWNPAARWFSRLAELPIRQVRDEAIEDGEVFEVERDGKRRRFLPTFVENDPALGLVEDVGLLLRMPNPNNTGRTLTLCNGVFSRGVLGAVRCLTDAQLRDRNEGYLAERFGDSAEFGLLLRIPVLRGQSATPDLSNDAARYYVWPEQAG